MYYFTFYNCCLYFCLIIILIENTVRLQYYIVMEIFYVMASKGYVQHRMFRKGAN